MAPLNERGAAWQASKLKATESASVVYSRGALSATVDAVLGMAPLMVGDGRGGTKIIVPELDVLIFPADLILGGVLAEPKRGDRVRVTRGAVAKEYIVTPPAQDEAEWRYTDGHEAMFRVHLKHSRTL